MPCARPDTPCTLYYDSEAVVEPGHFIATRAGSGYSVISARLNAKRPGRYHLRCLRLPAADIPPGSTVHELIWYRRTKSRDSLKVKP